MEIIRKGWEMTKSFFTLNMDKEVAIIITIAIIALIAMLYSIQYFTCNERILGEFGSCLKTFCFWGIGWC